MPAVRLDKFLKISRLVKRRTVANELSTGGGVLLNGKVAKPATEVKAGDILVLLIGRHRREVRIESVPEKAVPVQAAALLYTVIADTYNSAQSSPVE